MKITHEIVLENLGFRKLNVLYGLGSAFSE